MKFEIIIDDTFLNINLDENLSPTDNKYVLSLVNDFEDNEWRYKKFQNFIWNNIAETSLSHKERNSLVDQSHSMLTTAAKNLRLTDKEKDISKGSEVAEIVLYGIMKHYYSALPVVPKIFYKQNAQDNAKGADSVHLVIENDTDFSVWFGEAKFYNSIEDDRLLSIVKSVGNSLQTDKLKKENSIITNISDIDTLPINATLKKSIIETLSNSNSMDNIKPKIHIPILLLHECEITKNTDSLSNEYIKDIVSYHKDRATAYFKKQISNIGDISMYGKVQFHIILFPVPDKKKIIDKFISNVVHYKEQ